MLQYSDKFAGSDEFHRKMRYYCFSLLFFLFSASIRNETSSAKFRFDTAENELSAFELLMILKNYW